MNENLNNFYSNYDGLSNFLASQNIDQDFWNKLSLDEQSGILNSLEGLGGTSALGNTGVTGSLNNILGTNMSGMDFLKGGLGLGQLGLG